MKSFSNINTWIFDLDNTLYPRHCDLFSQIDFLMTDYVTELTGLEKTEARKLQKELYRDFGTTLRGLMETRNIDPHDFLDKVHDIDYTELPGNPNLADLLANLPGRKLIYTNGSVKHAENTLSALGVSHEIFDSIFDIVASDFEPKPNTMAFSNFISKYEIELDTAAMFEDIAKNLEPAKANGIATVLITPQSSATVKMENWEKITEVPDYVDHVTDDLDGFLKEILLHLEQE